MTPSVAPVPVMAIVRLVLAPDHLFVSEIAEALNTSVEALVASVRPLVSVGLLDLVGRPGVDRSLLRGFRVRVCDVERAARELDAARSRLAA